MLNINEVLAKSVRSRSDTAVIVAEGPGVNVRFPRRMYFYPRAGVYTVVYRYPCGSGLTRDNVRCLRVDANKAVEVYNKL